MGALKGQCSGEAVPIRTRAVPEGAALKPRPRGAACGQASLDVSLFGLAAWQTATVVLLGQARSPGGLDAETTGACRLARTLLGGWLGTRFGGRSCRRHSHGNRLDNRLDGRLGRLAQLSQRRALAHRRVGSIWLCQRTLAGLAGYVVGHGSADQGLTAAPTGGIEAIGGIVSNQNRTSPEALTMKRRAFSHSLKGLAEQDVDHRQGTEEWHFAIIQGMLVGLMRHSVIVCPAICPGTPHACSAPAIASPIAGSTLDQSHSTALPAPC